MQPVRVLVMGGEHVATVDGPTLRWVGRDEAPDGTWVFLGELHGVRHAAVVVDRVPAALSPVSIRVLAPLLGIGDPRTDTRIEFVGGIRGTGELAQRAGAAGVAFSMHPTSPDELLAVADAGEIMPPKSTWFEPKLRDGMFSHVL